MTDHHLMFLFLNEMDFCLKQTLFLKFFQSTLLWHSGKINNEFLAETGYACPFKKAIEMCLTFLTTFWKMSTHIFLATFSVYTKLNTSVVRECTVWMTPFLSFQNISSGLKQNYAPKHGCFWFWFPHHIYSVCQPNQSPPFSSINFGTSDLTLGTQIEH